MIYPDLECILEDYQTNRNDESIPWTVKKNIHFVCGYSIAHIDTQSNKSIADFFNGLDSLEVLCRALKYHSVKIFNSWNIKEEGNDLTTSQEENYNNSDKCYFCNKEFCNDLKNKDYFRFEKVITHDPYIGKYIGASHSICNLRYKSQKYIPVMIHNGSNYDFKLLVRYIAEHFRKDIYLIPENIEKIYDILFSYP